ncbi:MAG: hypothetical protein AAGG01_10775 [Planctomycetota bacterium]
MPTWTTPRLPPLTSSLARRLILSTACAVFVAQAPSSLAASQVEASSQEATYELGSIDVSTADIYPDNTSALRRFINATHWTTRESVIRREIWKRPGDTVDERFAEELERNLRALGLFAEVTVDLVPSADSAPGVRNLVVRTRDRLSISGGAGASFVGDATSGSVSLSESNFLGLGDRLRFSVTENDFGETRGQLSYRDRYFLGSWTTATATAGRAEEGDFYAVSFDRPFRYLEDDFAWNITGGTTAIDQDYFFSNSTIAEVPIDIARLETSVRWRSGTRYSFTTRGLAARYGDFDYSAARGPSASTIDVPGDTQTLFAGGTLGITRLSTFREVTGLDTLRFVQDVQLGWTGSLEAGAVFRDEDGSEDSTQPQVTARYSRIAAGGETRFLSTSLSGTVRTDDGEATGWRTDVGLRAFDLSLRPHTLALAVSYTEAEENENLPVQLTLGERNGLRGYPNREFTGQRFARINLEDRIDLDARLGTLDFGAVVFADAAWIGDRGEDLEGPFTSAGVGLRIGSNPLFGRGVLRLDLSFPFDDANGESFDPLLSFTLGQVFTL